MNHPVKPIDNSPRLLSISGNSVVAEAAVHAGCRFYAGYPITPSSEIAADMSRLMPDVDGVFIQMEDEIAAMGAIIGAALAGKKVMTATSGPGFSLKQENIGFACMTETPCVIVNVMRGGPSTGLPTLPSQGDVMQARWGTHGDHSIIALAPSTLTEVYHETIRAFNLAEQFRIPVVLLLDEVLGHMSERLEIPDPQTLEIVNRTKPTSPTDEYLPYKAQKNHVPDLADFFEGYRYHVTGLTHDETGFPTENPEISQALIERLTSKIEANLEVIQKYEEYQTQDAEIVICAYGSVARSAQVAVMDARKKGMKVGLFKPLTLWPFPRKRIAEIASKAKTILVPELNMGQIVGEVERVSKTASVVALNKANGQLITPDEIVDKLNQILS